MCTTPNIRRPFSQRRRRGAHHGRRASVRQRSRGRVRGLAQSRIGYKKAAQISLLAYREDLSLKDAVLKLGFLTAEQFDKWVRPADMTHPLAS
jgi:fumarate hydratase class II